MNCVSDWRCPVNRFTGCFFLCCGEKCFWGHILDAVPQVVTGGKSICVAILAVWHSVLIIHRWCRWCFALLFFVSLSSWGVNVFLNTVHSRPLRLHPSRLRGNGHATVLGKHHYASTKREREISSMVGASKLVSICVLMSSALQPRGTFNWLPWPGGDCVFSKLILILIPSFLILI